MAKINYSGIVTPQFVAEMSMTIHTAFPSLESAFTNLLFSYLVSQEFSPYRIFKAVEYVVQNCLYPNPTIANFFKPFDFQIHLFEFNELYDELWGKYKHDWQSSFKTQYQKFTLQNQEFFVSKNDVITIQPFLQQDVFAKYFGGSNVL